MGERIFPTFLVLFFAVLYLTTERPIFAYQQEIPANIRVDSGWNLISIPLEVSNSFTHSLFPGAVSEAFFYQNGYVSQETLKHGFGYWLKFDIVDTISITGTTCTASCINLVKGWNLVGSIDITIANSSYFANPCTLIVSDFFEYNSSEGYLSVDSLISGKGYWIKSSGDGELLYDSLGSRWNNISDIVLQTITLDHRNPNIIYGGLRSNYGNGIRGRLYKSYNGGFTWDTLITDLDCNGVRIDPINDSILYLTIGGAYCGPPSIPPGILKSTDMGITWSRADTGIYIDCEMTAHICAIDYMDNDILYAIGGGFLPGSFYKSTNAGRLWYEPIDFDTIDCGTIDPRCALTMQPNVIMNRNNPDVLYAAHVDWGDDFLIKGLHKGEEWSYIGLLPEGGGALANDIEQESTLYAGGYGFYISTDEGISWSLSVQGMPEFSYVDGIMITNNPSRLFIILYYDERFDIYETTDRGHTWRSLSCPDAVSIQDIDFDDDNNTIYALINEKLYRKKFNPTFPN